MRLITNPGTNLPADFIAEHDVEILPQQIVVDDVHHDTRSGVSLHTIDAWVMGAKVHPYVLGTSAAEFAGHLSRLGANDLEQLVITTSRNLINSYDACVAGRRTLENHPRWKQLKVRVIDSTVTDVATGMLTIYLALARRAGHGLEQCAELAQAFVAATRAWFVVKELDYLVRGGRASFLKAWAAKFLGVRPILELASGQVESVGRYKTKEPPSEVLRDWVRTARVPDAGRRVWLGISHGNAPDQAGALADTLGQDLDVQRTEVLPLTPSVYLHSGPGSVLVSVTDLDALPWVPPSG